MTSFVKKKKKSIQLINCVSGECATQVVAAWSPVQ